MWSGELRRMDSRPRVVYSDVTEIMSPNTTRKMDTHEMTDSEAGLENVSRCQGNSGCGCP
jgi:hypothetical protein